MTRPALLILSLLMSGCALRAALVPTPLATASSDAVATAPPPAPASAAEPQVASAVDAVAAAAAPGEAIDEADEADDAEDGEGAEDDDGEEVADPAEEESVGSDPNAADPNAIRFTSDLSEQDLVERWKAAPESLGSISLGFAHQGRLMNAEKVPAGQGWVVVSPEQAWATRETIDFIVAAASEVHRQYPSAPPLRVNQLSRKDGGWLRPHRSHQNGRDVDFGFYYPTPNPILVRAREKVLDPALNWALVKALVTLTEVQVILVDRRVQKVLYDHALAAGEDKAFLDAIFNNGRESIVQHARRHRDHFHVRFFNPRAQELGRRVTPLLALRPEQNMVSHRVRSGDTLSHIARRYNSSVKAIQQANRMRGTFLRLAQVLKVPMRGPCTKCPLPPPVQLRPRLVPPPRAAVQPPRALPVEVAATEPEAPPAEASPASAATAAP